MRRTAWQQQQQQQHQQQQLQQLQQQQQFWHDPKINHFFVSIVGLELKKEK